MAAATPRGRLMSSDVVPRARELDPQRLSVAARKATIAANYAADVYLRTLPRLPSPRAPAALAEPGGDAARA